MRTRITEMLGIKYPIFMGAMAWVTRPKLVAAVSEAGGLGVIAASIYDGDSFRKAVAEIKARTTRPFGANVMANAPHLEELVSVIIDEEIPVVTYGVGNPERLIKRIKPHGIKAIPVIPSVKHAVRAENDGADAMVIEGMEAGGHIGYISTIPLVPQVVDRVKVPVVAAGGIGDARGVAAAFALGAEGVQMGSRFIVTQESEVPDNIKRMIIEARIEDTVITGNITGLRCRVLRNKLADEFLKMEDMKTSKEEMNAFGLGKMRTAFVEGDGEDGSIMVGQICGMINDIPTCKELIERIVEGAVKELDRARMKLLTD